MISLPRQLEVHGTAMCESARKEHPVQRLGLLCRLASPANEIHDPTYYITYKGSLTTPPCTEGVTRIVMMAHPTLSLDQLMNFASQRNFRPPQPLNGRVPVMFCDGNC